MTQLIFEPSVAGHHLEYLHYYYLGAVAHPEDDYIFLVTRKFEEVKDKYEWQHADNITFEYIAEKYDKQFNTDNIYVLGWKASCVLRDYVNEFKPDKVLLTMITQFIPFICWLLPGNVKVRGIIYIIYLYEQDRMSRIRLLAEKIRFWLSARSKVIEKVFVLNDEASAENFNQLYHTDKFTYIPDPIPEVDMSAVKDRRDELKIPKQNLLFLHFGGLSQRKGTLDILNAIINCDEQSLSDKTFVFAGKVYDSLYGEFYRLLEDAKKKVQILVFDEFCSYEFLYDLCYSCDLILMPYHQTNLSSGLLGYAAVFQKQVIGPSSGLIGFLIKKYNLGITCSGNLEKVIKSISKRTIMPIQSMYCVSNSSKTFIETIVS